jgi:hypothetical protein
MATTKAIYEPPRIRKGNNPAECKGRNVGEMCIAGYIMKL